MSDLNDLIATNAVRTYNQGVERGVASERERIIEMLKNYFELTLLPGDNGVEENPEWDCGFQAAIALIKGNKSEEATRNQ